MVLVEYTRGILRYHKAQYPCNEAHYYDNGISRITLPTGNFGGWLFAFITGCTGVVMWIVEPHFRRRQGKANAVTQ